MTKNGGFKTCRRPDTVTVPSCMVSSRADCVLGVARLTFLRQMAGKPFDRRKTKPPAKAISGIDYASNFMRMMFANPCEEYEINPVVTSPSVWWRGSMNSSHSSYSS